MYDWNKHNYEFVYLVNKFVMLITKYVFIYEAGGELEVDGVQWQFKKRPSSIYFTKILKHPPSLGFQPQCVYDQNCSDVLFYFSNVFVFCSKNVEDRQRKYILISLGIRKFIDHQQPSPSFGWSWTLASKY
jgi:hypothetical protein